MAGIVKQTIYTRQWREDPEFRAALERARVMAADVLEAEAHRWAVEGVAQPVGVYQGEAGGTIPAAFGHATHCAAEGCAAGAVPGATACWLDPGTGRDLEASG